MIKTSTQPDAIRYIYNELDERQKREMDIAVFFDEELDEEIFDFQSLKQELDRIEYGLSPKTEASIMDFAKTAILPEK